MVHLVVLLWTYYCCDFVSGVFVLFEENVDSMIGTSVLDHDLYTGIAYLYVYMSTVQNLMGTSSGSAVCTVGTYRNVLLCMNMCRTFFNGICVVEWMLRKPHPT